MSDLVNYTKRGIELPQGCKDLIDVLRSGGEELPSLVRSTTEGLRHLDGHMARLLSGSSDYAVLSILAFDLQSAVYIERVKHVLSAVVIIKQANSAAEQAVRETFRLAGAFPSLDEVAGGEGGARVLKYPLPATLDLALIPAVLRAACNATEHAGLYYDCHKNKAG